MAIISYIDDASHMAEAFVSKSYSSVDAWIKREQGNISYYCREGDMLAGYNITNNEALSSLYNMRVYVVRFVLSNIDTHHSQVQYIFMEKLFLKLKEQMEQMGGYFNVRVPSHVVDVIKLFNKTFPTSSFCGGTVQQFVYGKKIGELSRDGVVVGFRDEDYINKYRTMLLNIAYNSFASYQGQYHISDVMESKAGLIYSNWLKNSMENIESNIIVVESNSIPVGFATIEEKDTSVEVLLTAIDEKYRGRGLYRAMIAYVINYAEKKDKSFIISTQFDNFIVQGVWSSLGLTPFYSIYNFHINI